MNRLQNWLIVAAFVFAITANATRAQHSPPQPTLVKAGRLLDPRTGNVLSPAAVLVENRKIKEVGPPPKVQVSPGAKVVDLGNATLLPGLIVGHAHLLLDVVLPMEAERALH